MQTKRILFILPLPPPVHGSAMVSQYIKDSKIINDTFDCDFVNLSTSRRMEEIGKKSIVKIFRFLSFYVIVLFKLLSKRYDLCYLAITCHGNGFLKDAPFVLLCKLFGRKVVIHQHNKGMSKEVDRPIYRKLLPMVYKNTFVILLSWRLYPDIEKVVKREQVLICPNGIPNEFESEPHFERNNKIPRLLFLSNLIESKGVFVLLDACKILKDKGYSFICDFVGGETKEIDKERFRDEVVKRGLMNNVVYKGKLYGEDKRQIYSFSDIFVFPTYYENETFGLVNLEAMKYKLPIISTREGAIPDVVIDGENGFLVNRQDSISLSEKIEELFCSGSLRKQMGEVGYMKFKEKFTLNAFENKLVECMKTIINQ